MTEVPFLGPRLKVERAERHILDLEAAKAAFLAGNPYPVTMQFHPEYGRWRVAGETTGGVPPTISLITGDAVHNLRSALDIMVCDIAALNGDSRRAARFPFGSHPDEGEAFVRKKVKELRLPDDVSDMILELKPYYGGNDHLLGLHKLDIIDKHQLILLTGRQVSITCFGIQCHSSTGIGEGTSDFSVYLPHISGPFVLDKDVKVTREVTFGYGQPFQFQPIMPTLVQLTELVKGVVETFATHCLQS